MPVGATIRQLGKLTAHGVLAPLSSEVDLVVARLSDEQALAKARIHPVQILLAQKVYESGHGVKGSLTWTPDRRILQAMEEAFYLSFKYVVPTGKKIAVAIDCSGSMTGGWGYNSNGTLSPAEIAAAMATVIVNTEPKSVLLKFDTRAEIVNYPVSARVSDIHRLVDNMSGGTDIACPILELIRRNIKVDAVIILTDSETWAGRTHVTEAARLYNRNYGRTKFVNVAAVANHYTTLDPQDVNALEVVGFDGTVPQVINEFIRD
jgi:60 kDa SS-A/Ro ribonucleoprotein